MATTEEKLGRKKAEPLGNSPEPAQGLEFEADYEEDRPISVLAERQREFQRAMQGRFVDTEMPAA